MQSPAPRLTAVMGLGRALIDTLGPGDAADVLISEFGWDLAFQALALVRGDDAGTAFGIAWQRLVLDPLSNDLRTQPY